MEMENTLRMTLLFDFYGSLLTERQRDAFQMYFHEDLSLGEVGEELDVSRQAIYDILKRVGAILEEFEDKLGLVKKHQERQQIYDEVLQLINMCLSEGQNVSNLRAIEEKIKKAQATS